MWQLGPFIEGRRSGPCERRRTAQEIATQEIIVSHTPTGLSARRWLGLFPAIFVIYTFAYGDRANYVFGTAAGMAHDLHVGAGAVSLPEALSFLGYFVFQIPGAARRAPGGSRGGDRYYAAPSPSQAEWMDTLPIPLRNGEPPAV